MERDLKSEMAFNPCRIQIPNPVPFRIQIPNPDPEELETLTYQQFSEDPARYVYALIRLVPTNCWFYVSGPKEFLPGENKEEFFKKESPSQRQYIACLILYRYWNKDQ